MLPEEKARVCQVAADALYHNSEFTTECLNEANPTIFEGLTRTGRPFYAIYRHGKLRVGVAPDGGSADDAMVNAVQSGLDGGFHYDSGSMEVELRGSRLWRHERRPFPDKNKVTFAEIVTECPQFIFL